MVGKTFSRTYLDFVPLKVFTKKNLLTFSMFQCSPQTGPLMPVDGFAAKTSP
jgi:hypothetical protein